MAEAGCPVRAPFLFRTPHHDDDASRRPYGPTVSVRDRQESPNGRLDMDIPNLAGSRLGLTERETPASVTVVDRATIEARGARDTHDILHSMPGVDRKSTRLNSSHW